MDEAAKIINFSDDSKLIQSSQEFVAGFVPPDYLLDGILQRRYLYSLTGRTGEGKTAIATLIVGHVVLGRPVGNKEVGRGRVVYFAGENPDDVRMRWIAQTQQFGLTPDDFDNVSFLPGAYKLSEILARIREEVGDEELSLLIIDTSAAYFEGDDENGNVQAGTHARRLRELIKLPGGPTVLVCCHPTKNAGDDNLLPRGGGAFVAEMDGNLTARKKGSVVEVHWQGKFRGPDFAPLTFQLKTVTHERLKDTRGRLIPTVIAQPLSEQGQQEIAATSRRDEDTVLQAIAKNPSGSLSELAAVLGWLLHSGDPNKMRVSRARNTLLKYKLIREHRGDYELTPAGYKELEKGP